MSNVTKYGVPAAVLLGILAVFIWVQGGDEPGMPELVNARLITLVDEATAETMERPYSDWDASGKRGGKYKNPETGDYTMVVPIDCPQCGAQIPPCPLDEAALAGKTADEILALKAAYKCPKCGKPVGVR